MPLSNSDDPRDAEDAVAVERLSSIEDESASRYLADVANVVKVEKKQSQRVENSCYGSAVAPAGRT